MINLIFNNINFFFFTVSGYFCLLSNFAFFILSFSFYFSFCHVLTIANNLISSFICCLFAKSKQNTRFLQKLQHKLKWSLFFKLKKAQTNLLWLITQLNIFCGPLFFLYFFLNIPINAYLFMLFIRGQVLGSNKIFIFILLVGQYNAIFGIHCKNFF